MPHYHQTIAVGHVGQDPELRVTQSGKSVLTWSLAVTEKWQGGEHTEWYRCVLFGDRAERIASWFRKGDPLMVVGAMRTRKYQDRDGNERRSAELSVRDVQFLKQREQRQPAPQERPAQGTADYGAEDDIPF